jgi:hypothetical protein
MNYDIFYDLTTETENYNIYAKKINKYINDLKGKVNNEVISALKNYEITYDDFCMRFYDFDKEEFKKKEFENFINGFCERIDTVYLMLK